MTQPRNPVPQAVQYWYDAAIERREERDQLRAVVARVRQMADAWEQQLPEVIRTPAVVSAIRAALEPAVVSPPADRAAAPTVWIDGHPQLEAIARAVWEQCGTDECAVVTIDDPRNIAVAALAAVLPAPDQRAAAEERLGEELDAAAESIANRTVQNRKLEDDLATARATNQRLNLRAQRLESELAAYRRAVTQWEISERGTYIPLSSLRVIGLASGRDILGGVRHLKHFERVEQAEAAIEKHRLALSQALDLGTGAPWDAIHERVAELRRLAGEAQQDETSPSCPDPIECGHEAAMGLAEMKLDQIRAKATEWQALAPADDWGLTPQDTLLADVGRYLLRLLDGAQPAREAQQDPAPGGEARETEEQRADREETERDHAAGDHRYCGQTCEVEFPTEHLRNFVLAKGYPGTKGALDELLRRAAVARSGQPETDGEPAP